MASPARKLKQYFGSVQLNLHSTAHRRITENRLCTKYTNLVKKGSSEQGQAKDDYLAKNTKANQLRGQAL